jgi:hypothetical protein
MLYCIYVFVYETREFSFSEAVLPEIFVLKSFVAISFGICKTCKLEEEELYLYYA